MTYTRGAYSTDGDGLVDRKGSWVDGTAISKKKI